MKFRIVKKEYPRITTFHAEKKILFWWIRPEYVGGYYNSSRDINQIKTIIKLEIENIGRLKNQIKPKISTVETIQC